MLTAATSLIKSNISRSLIFSASGRVRAVIAETGV
jgi:hypothetical protein